MWNKAGAPIVIFNIMAMRLVLAAAGGMAMLAMTGCVVEEVGKTEHETTHISLGKAESVRAELDMGAGELHVTGGATELLNANFAFNRQDWKPVVDYNGNSFRGLLTIRQGHDHDGGIHLGNNEYKWDLQFNNDIPIDLYVNCGAGEGRLDLSQLTLRALDVNMGVGEVEATLPPEPKRDYDVRIHGGIGEAVVHLPTKVGVVADASGGIGEIHTEGLHKHGGRWVNDVYEQSSSPITVHVQVQGGIGEIRLLATEG